MQIHTFTDALGLSSPQQREKAEQRKKIENVNPAELGEKVIFLSWEAPSRSLKKPMSDKLRKTLVSVGTVVVLLFILMREYFVVMAIASVVFFIQILSKTTPEDIKYELSSHGIKYGEQMYYWVSLVSAFFMKIDGLDFLAFDTFESIPGRIYVNVSGKNLSEIEMFVSKHMTYLKVAPKSQFEKIFDFVSSKFNFE
jgi:hypothetical protein